MPRSTIAALLALLLMPAAVPATAVANHQGWDEPAGEEQAVGDAEAPAEDLVDWDDDGDGDWDSTDENAEWWDDPDNIEAPLPDAPTLPTPAPTRRPRPAPAIPPVVVKGKTVKGKQAMMRADGKAAIPRSAPKKVRAVIAAANLIVGKPYKWGGGHARLFDSGYDCSGSVSYALIRNGLLGGPQVSGQLASYGSGGSGRWISVYANKGHVYMEVAGLRFDTSPVGDPTGRRGVRWRPVIGRRAGFHARHPVGL